MKAWTSSFGFLALIFFLLCAPLLLSTRSGGYADDEDRYHLPAVRQIRAHWPALDLNRDTRSAVSPGYHYLLATVSLVTGTGRLPLRLVTWALSLALLALLWRQFPVEARGVALAALLPLACSNFFVKSAAWIVTDNPGLLAATAVLALVFSSQVSGGNWAGGLYAGTATFLRQLHVWTIAPLALRAWRRRSALALLPLLIPLGVLGLLAVSWHGLVPPAWQSGVALPGSSPFASLVYLLAVGFILGSFYYWALAPEDAARDWRSPWTLAAGLAGLVLALAGPTDYDMAAGRWGGYLWSAAAFLPVIGSRSLLFTVLTPLGAALLAVMTRRLLRQTEPACAWCWLGSFLAWAATALVNRLAFHRYFEPTLLIFLIFWVLLMIRCAITLPVVRVRRLYLLAIVQGVITLATAHYQTFGHGRLAGHG